MEQMHTRHLPRVVALVAVVAGLALLAAACSSGGSSDAATSGSGGGTPVTIASPANGAHVGRSVEVKMNLGFAIGQPDTGRKHIHLHVDNSSQYTISYTATHTLQLDPGKHTIVAVVANADHSETKTRSRPVTVDVGSGSGTGGGAGTTSNTSGTPGY
jgi:hypothetical protein